MMMMMMMRVTEQRRVNDILRVW